MQDFQLGIFLKVLEGNNPLWDQADKPMCRKVQ
jgi:hypothetical protein